jgi:hypothetical protein
MTTHQYRTVLKRLGWSIVGASRYLHFSRRQAQRIAAGDTLVPKLPEKVLRLLLSGKITTEDLL